MKKASAVLGIVGMLVMMMGVGGVMLAEETDEEYTGIRNSQIWHCGAPGRGYARGDEIWPGSIQGYVGNGEVMGIDELNHEVTDYIADYGDELIIGDIFVYEETEYYYSIIEEDTGMGAMELLVDPYTGNIFPEYGPNRMWNLKYGVHHPKWMMGDRGIMSRYYRDGSMTGVPYEEDNDLSAEEAYNKGAEYLSKYKEDLSMGETFHEFYGYFTYHVLLNDEPVGMLSVNGFSGDVWYHSWHGELIEIIERHEDGHN